VKNNNANYLMAWFLLTIVLFGAIHNSEKKQEGAHPTTRPLSSKIKEEVHNIPVPAPNEDAEAKSYTNGYDRMLGEHLFLRTCSACHGRQGQGVLGLGKSMAKSKFVSSLNDAKLLAFIKKSAYPCPPTEEMSLTDQELRAIVAHIRTITSGTIETE